MVADHKRGAKIENPVLSISKAGPENDTSELLVFMCYYAWKRNGSKFTMDEKYKAEMYNYRDIQKDSMRCYLLYIPIHIAKYLVDISAKPKAQVNADEVFEFVIYKLKLLKFGLQTLLSNDYHLIQIMRMLKAIKDSAGAVLTAYGIMEDFDKIAETLSQD